MNFFPVSNSIISEKHLNDFLIDQFKLDQSTSCTLIKNWVNDTYLIQNGKEKFVYRIYRFNWRTKKEIEEELRFINLLKEKSISVSFPILDKNENHIQEFLAPEGKRHGVLFSFAEGEKQLSLSPKLHLKAGELMAQIHQNSENLKLDRITYNQQVLLSHSFEKIKTQLSGTSPEYDFISNLKTDLSIFLNELKQSKIRKGVVHLDLWADNFNIDKNGKITLFDFDFCGNGFLVFDIAYHLVMLFIFESKKENYIEKVNQFYKGYESNIEISIEEKRIIPQVGVALLFYYLSFQCEKFSAIFVNENYIKGFINLRIKHWVEFHK